MTGNSWAAGLGVIGSDRSNRRLPGDFSRPGLSAPPLRGCPRPTFWSALAAILVAWAHLFADEPASGTGNVTRKGIENGSRAAVPNGAAKRTGAQPQNKAEIATESGPEAARPLSATAKNRMLNEFRLRGPDQRQAIAREMMAFRDLELTRFLIQQGLRDRTPAVLEAVQSALMASRGDPPHDSLVIDAWRAELRAPIRATADYAIRLASAVGNRRTFAAWTELARAAFDGDGARRGECLDALLAALDRVGADRDAAALEALEQLTRSPWFDQSQGIRRSLVDAARRFEQTRALGLLVACLERADGEMRFASAERLAELTGQPFGADPAAWRAWWREKNAREAPGGAGDVLADAMTATAPPTATPTLTPTSKPATTRAPASTPKPTATTTATVSPSQGERRTSTGRELAGAPLYYYDLPVRAQRVVFVLDVSKSMGLGGTTSRLAAAQRELTRTIGSLADGTLFNIVVFHENVATWQERLYPATEATRAHAAAFVRGQRPQGKTATYDALHTALSMSPTPEVIYVLSDGIPSAGGIVAPDRVLEAVRKDNQRLRVAIHALGTLAGPRDAGLADFLERLAAQNYGQFRRLE